jgi:hypothetical protein
MTPIKPTEAIWKKYMTMIKDIAFVIGLLISIIGWIRSEAIKQTKLQVEVENLTTIINDNTKQLEKINDILDEQQNLNGQIIQYMKMKN